MEVDYSDMVDKRLPEYQELAQVCTCVYSLQLCAINGTKQHVCTCVIAEHAHITYAHTYPCYILFLVL